MEEMREWRAKLNLQGIIHKELWAETILIISTTTKLMWLRSTLIQWREKTQEEADFKILEFHSCRKIRKILQLFTQISDTSANHLKRNISKYLMNLK
jgi:hypothetical protein